MRFFERLCNLAVGYLAAYGLLIAAGGFSERQRSVLSLTGSALALYWDITKQREFRPFWVQIVPDWKQLFADHGIDWEEAVRQQSAYADTAKTPDPYYIGFNVVGPNLLYSTSFHRFFSELGIEKPFDARDPTKTLFSPGGPQFAPAFYVRERLDFDRRIRRWEFGLITTDSRSKAHEFDRESRFMPAASIPKDIFGSYYGTGISNTKLARLEKTIEQAGWKRDEHDCLTLKHKYLTLSYGGLTCIGAGP